MKSPSEKNKIIKKLKKLIQFKNLESVSETLYLLSIPGMKEKIQDGIKTPLSDCINEEDLNW